MNDCTNADVRDLLPDLLHGRLDAAARASVEAHVAACADCAAELAVLRNLRSATGTPKVDIASIVAALPAYRAPARRSWVGWRSAAAIAVIVAGASSVAVLQRGVPTEIAGVAHSSTVTLPPRPPVVASTHVPSTTGSVPTGQAHTGFDSTVGPSATLGQAPSAAVAVAAPRELAMGGGTLGDLDNRELASLLKDIESLDAVPSVDVESTPVSPISPASPGTP